MDSKNLVSEFDRVLFNHFLDSPFLEHSPVHGDSIKAFERQPKNAGLSILNSSLTFHMRPNILFEFGLLVQVVFLSLCYEGRFRRDFRVVNPFQRRVSKFVWVVICDFRKEASFDSCLDLFLLLLFPHSIVLWLLNELLGNIIILEVDLSELSFDFSSVAYFSSDVSGFRILSVIF